MTDPALLAEFDRRFRRDPDPWRFETSDYERAKHAATVEACGDLTHRTVLELGAANGVLAARLAPTTRQLIAVEGVPAAAELARVRLADLPHARVVEGLIPGAVPPGPFDVVVASEILYYLQPESYRATLAAISGWLAPGGRLVTVHWRPTSDERPRSADQVHDDLVAQPALTLTETRDTDDYLLAIFARVR